MNSVMSAGNNGSGASRGGGERRREEKKLAVHAVNASSKKGCMKGKGGPLNASCTFKGVRQRTWGRWVSEIRQPKTEGRLWLGTYDSSREAAMAYDAAALELFGPNTPLNLPDEVPDLPPPEHSVSLEALVLVTTEALARLRGPVSKIKRMHGGRNHFKEPVGESTFENLNFVLPNYHSHQTICDPGISAMAFDDHAIGFEIEQPFMV
ncbi:hypothetical protein L1987_08548 [Smallanthus sonchifolius]|uniref:Uncharacterized protein n=1 Tax=Smallanthus sonchifolius TaxID=185202 RepID=A0ACB9JNY5_9ASTR|nr:hypothetical protein L1987_08548 [Smallanthus sonchifolius]